MTPALAIYSFLERFLPTGIFGLWLAAFVAAGMSTGDTYMLIGATNISRDIYKRWIKRDATDAQIIRLTRVLMIFLAAISTYVVIQFRTVWSIWSWGAMMFASAIFVPLVPGILWRWRKHPDSAWIAIASALAIFIPLYPPPGIAPHYVENVARFIGVTPFSPAHQAYIFLGAWLVSTLVYLFVNLGFGERQVKRERRKPEERPMETAGQVEFYNRNTFLLSVLFWLLAPAAIIVSIVGGSAASFLWYFLGGLNVLFGLIILWQVIRARKELLALK
jgi:Na+/proline symporter